LPPDFVQSAYSALGAIRKTLVPRYIRVRISAEEYSNERFAREVGEQVVPRLEYLQKKVGFVEVEVEERGGIFWLLGNRLKTLPHYIAFQYVYPLVRPRNQLRNLSRSTPLNFIMALLVLPVYLVTLPFLGFLIPLLFFTWTAWIADDCSVWATPAARENPWLT